MSNSMIASSNDKVIVALCAAADVEPGEIVQGVLPGGHTLAVYNVDGDFYITDDTCTHGEASLAEDGMLEGDEVECTWHFGRFKVATGEACAMPCTIPLRTWPVIMQGDQICTEADSSFL